MNKVSPVEANFDRWPDLFAAALKQKFGPKLLAILLYGSYLRGKRDTVLDFYVIVSDYGNPDRSCQAFANWALPPNVYNLVLTEQGEKAMAKYAVVSEKQFVQSLQRDFTPYFWARFCQPSHLLYAHGSLSLGNTRAIEQVAGHTMLHNVLPLMPVTFSDHELWEGAFRLTYQCELRSEGASKPTELFRLYEAHLVQLTEFLAADLGLTRLGTGEWCKTRNLEGSPINRVAWAARMVVGKLLCALRLIKAAFTFNDALAYVLWKVERHSGVRVEATESQHARPLLYAWPVIWRLFRQGGFK